MEIKKDRLYSQSHEWVLFEDDTTATVGLSDYAQSELGDLVFVNLPQEGDPAVKGETIADVESVKAVSDVFSPVSGTVQAINEELLDTPEKINQAPYDAWLCRIKDVTGKDGLLTAEEYEAFVAGL
ncbi:MAG: glycine cleavage system protein GcvH [Clostridiales bacterium]|nr:glycine cleavage system protein GcvH [Clostridiales bacterium]